MGLSVGTGLIPGERGKAVLVRQAVMRGKNAWGANPAPSFAKGAAGKPVTPPACGADCSAAGVIASWILNVPTVLSIVLTDVAFLIGCFVFRAVNA